MIYTSITAPVQQLYFVAGQAVEDRSYAALIGPAAAICTHRRTGLAAVVISHPVPNGLAAM